MTPPRLLYCSPVLPAPTGNGLAMRAGTVLRALAERYRVSLLVAPRYWSPADTLPASIRACCEQVAVTAEGGAFASPATRPYFEDEPFDVVHVFRLATVDAARPWLDRRDGRRVRHLDLDDVESVTARRIAERCDRTGHPELATAEREAAERAAVAETAALRTFDRVYVCSGGDRTVLESRRGPDGMAAIEILPNALAAPQPVAPPPADAPFTFLFIGTLSYLPNEDGILSFCREVLPGLRRMATRPFRVSIVGIGATPAVQQLAAIPEVEVIGAVADVADAYRAAHAVIVPLRAGGGTRIKVLEAFAYGRPVVATPVGAEGIAARDGEHLLLADEPAALARQCARLLASPGLAARLARNAGELFDASYSFDALRQIVLALPPP